MLPPIIQRTKHSSRLLSAVMLLYCQQHMCLFMSSGTSACDLALAALRGLFDALRFGEWVQFLIFSMVIVYWDLLSTTTCLRAWGAAGGWSPNLATQRARQNKRNHSAFETVLQLSILIPYEQRMKRGAGEGALN
jgi:hypothetical protein